jgi:nucleotide-binding universal stress UspA family protein
VADLLLSQASDLGAELMVMGGYHHSRVREFILGGVTRTIVETMTVPVLLSH